MPQQPGEWRPTIVLFARLISRIFSTNEQYFSLRINQSTILSTMTYQSSERDTWSCHVSRHAPCSVISLPGLGSGHGRTCVYLGFVSLSLACPGWHAYMYAWVLRGAGCVHDLVALVSLRRRRSHGTSTSFFADAACRSTDP